MITEADKQKYLQTGYLVMDWREVEVSGEDSIAKFPVIESSFSLRAVDNVPVNGRMIDGPSLDIEVGFGGVESETSTNSARPGIMVDIRGTHDELRGFGSVGSTITVVDYVCTDDWEVIASLYHYEYLDMLDAEIRILARSESSVLISIAGYLKYYTNLNKNEPIRPNPKFYFQHEISPAKFSD